MTTLNYRVKTNDGKCFLLKAEEHYNGLFSQQVEWEIYYNLESFWGTPYTYLTKISDKNRIAETIRINFEVKTIEAI